MSREKKWSAWPWRIDYDGVLCAPKNESIGRQFDEQLATFPWNSFREFNEPRNKANARLMCAAPDLVEALELASEILHDLPNDECDPLLDEAKKLCRNALYRAYGDDTP